MEKTATSSQGYDNFVEYASSNNEERSAQSEDEGSSWDIPIRSRQRFPRDQLKTLENLYASNKKPDYEDKQKLATKFGTSIKRIQIWFQNRRAKDKKEPKKQSSGGDNSPSVSIPPSPEDNNSIASTSATMVSTSQEPLTVNPIHISSRSPEKRTRFPRAPVSRRYPPQERHPMHFSTGTPMHNAAPPPPPFFYHHPYYHSDLWHPKFRVSAPQIVNQSRNTPVEHPQQRTPKRVTRSQSKRRKM